MSLEAAAIEALVRDLEFDEGTFGRMHDISEQQDPALAFAHNAARIAIEQIWASPVNRFGFDVGVQTYEIWRGLVSPCSVALGASDIFVAAQEPNAGSNFMLRLIDAMHDASEALVRVEPTLADAAERLALAYATERSRDLASFAVAGAAISWSLVEDATFWHIVNE